MEKKTKAYNRCKRLQASENQSAGQRIELTTRNLPQPETDGQQLTCVICGAPRADDLIGTDLERCDFCVAYRPPPPLPNWQGAAVYRFPASQRRREVRYAKAA